MKIQLTIKNTIAFIALMFVMHESHEIVHTTVGRLICGCWGIRDFNVWQVCEGCIEQRPIALISTFAGPIYTFSLIWLGYYWLIKATSQEKKAFGFALIFSNQPFGRLLGAALSGGDEVFGLKKIFGNHQLAWAVGFAIVFILSIPPIVAGFKAIGNTKKWLWFLGFLILPFIIDALVVIGVMNNLLEKGIMNETWILGSPILVSVWTIFVTITFFVFRRNINSLIIKK